MLKAMFLSIFKLVPIRIASEHRVLRSALGIVNSAHVVLAKVHGDHLKHDARTARVI